MEIFLHAVFTRPQCCLLRICRALQRVGEVRHWKPPTARVLLLYRVELDGLEPPTSSLSVISGDSGRARHWAGDDIRAVPYLHKLLTQEKDILDRHFMYAQLMRCPRTFAVLPEGISPGLLVELIL